MKGQVLLKYILNSDDVVSSIRDNMKDLTALIPEINDMVGFEHNHPHHHLDVWEHTLKALSVSPNNFDIRLALLLHDVGKPHCFQDEEVRHFRGHPVVSAHMTNDILKRLKYDGKYVDYICEIISRHDMPLLEEHLVANMQLSKTIFEVQKCDVLAHNPDKNTKRLEYIDTTAKMFKNITKTKNIDLVKYWFSKIMI